MQRAMCGKKLTTDHPEHLSYNVKQDGGDIKQWEKYS